MLRRLAKAWTQAKTALTDNPLDIPEWDDTDELAATPPADDTARLRAELADAHDWIADLEKQAATLTDQRDRARAELETTRIRLAAQHTTRHHYTDRAIQTPPPPTNHREEALREKERADKLARQLADTEQQLHALLYPRTRQGAHA